MSLPPSKPGPPVRLDPNALPPPKWWGKYILEGDPPQRRFVLRWKRILTLLGSFCLACYLALVTALWGYYSINRQIPGVNWIDIAILPRFSRVQAAIGASYYATAQAEWKKKDYIRAIFAARAAVQKSPADLEARIFLADCWRQLGRNQEAVRTLRDGVEFSASDPRLQRAAVETCLEAGRYEDALKLLRQDFPSHGVRLLDRKNWMYDLAEVKAVLETAGAASAAGVAAGHPELSTLPQAAPLLARIDLELGRGPAALERLRAARDHGPSDPTVLDAYVATASSLGRSEEARAAARRFLAAYPGLVEAQLRYLEVLGSRRGPDRLPWTAECMTFLRAHRHDAEAMARLASLAASQGWTDLAFLLYENSLQENLTGLPFAVYYAASLVKAGDAAEADAVWRQLALRNGPQIASSAYVEAMVAWGNGRQSEAMQIVERLRRDTANDASRRRSLETLFRNFGFPKIADQLAGNHA